MSNVWKGVTADPTASFSWKGEGSVAADAAPTFSQPVIDIYTADAWVESSRELSSDYPDWADQLQQFWTTAYNDFIATAIASGSGSSQPRGVFPAMQATTTNPSHVTVTTAGQIGVADVRKAWASLPDRWKSNAVWLMHENVGTQLRNINGAAAQLDFTTSDNGMQRMMGRPVVHSAHCPDFVGTTGAENFLVVGDFGNGYTVPVRLGLNVEYVREAFDMPSTGRPTFSDGWYCSVRLGGDVTVPAAFRLLSNS